MRYKLKYLATMRHSTVLTSYVTCAIGNTIIVTLSVIYFLLIINYICRAHELDPWCSSCVYVTTGPNAENSVNIS